MGAALDNSSIPMNQPWGAAMHPDGKHVIISDAGWNALLIMDLEHGNVSLFAGRPWDRPGSYDEVGARARFFTPRGLALSPDGDTLWVADSDNHCIRTVSLRTRRVTTYAGFVQVMTPPTNAQSLSP
ncbi:hypothetical protein T484DRAFT_1758310 [Baffinella frigidus]|nr:hypothetical protein T484DRAFT_1758310 [Cryptophyta sp. CCMP2293]